MGSRISFNTTNGLSIEYRPEALNNGSGTETVFGFGIDIVSGLSIKSYVRSSSSGGPSKKVAFRCNTDGEWSTEGAIISENNDSAVGVGVTGRGRHVNQVGGRCRTKFYDGMRMKLEGGVKCHRSSYDEELWCLKGELSKKETRVAVGLSGTDSDDMAWAEIDHVFEDEGLTIGAGGYLGKDEVGGFLSGRLDNGLQIAVGGSVDKNKGTVGPIRSRLESAKTKRLPFYNLR
ncbi:hypothetical protein ACJMK2_017262 [Sinanodonta woodiana]|uniref:Uncharacterized protein n=1 Tax=Sinanodonta woodiana TaxID=1069815 RepID=A0ABD3UZ01_SINWO